MTIEESLLTINSYPIPALTVERIGIVRGLTISEDFTAEVAASRAYRLAYADLLMWLHDSPNLTEQEAGVNNQIAIKKGMLDRANSIYFEFGDPAFRGGTYGFKGEDF